MNERQKLRKEKIAAREGLSAEERKKQSQKIVERILASTAFQNAEKILIYRGIGGEVRLDELENAIEAKGKQFSFPLCLPERRMAALAPKRESGWKKGSYGIPEPIADCSTLVLPEDIDMVICPCTAFDENCNRMGMGAGYYDRYLPQCRKAIVTAVAFEVQKAKRVPMEPWDKAVTLIFTEKNTYSKK